ncbi:MAG: DUF3857 and transglutaminase domain-containing protein [Candidatus Riflebacteria bacterium]|nr:DUF3857 and transglutaminase domain-containing protein [Candidatus Riflebacteria bacterium]
MPKKNVLFVYLLFQLCLYPCFCEVLTLTDGQITEVASLTLEKDSAYFSSGTESKTLGRKEIRDISFSGGKQRIASLATDVADLGNLYEKALEQKKKYPDSAAIMILDDGEGEYLIDGTRKFTYRCVLYIAKEEAMGAAGVSLSFDPDREKIKLIHARSYSPDRVVCDLQTNQIKLAKASGGSVYFNNYREMTFSIPKACVGGLIDYKYETEDYNPFDKKMWEGIYMFQGEDPVCDSVLRVKLPKEVPLYFKTFNFPFDGGKPKITNEDGKVVYEWRNSNVPPIIPEPCMPPLRDIVPLVAYNIQKDWKYSYDRLKPMYDKRFVITDLVKQKVEELTKGAKTLEEKISKLYLFCQKEIRYISIKGNLSSNQVGHIAEETLKNRYGDCTDKGMLFSTMLKCIGIEAYPVGIKTNTAGKAIRDLPMFDSNHCITEVNLNGKRSYLDSTASDYRYPYFRSDDHEVSAVNDYMGRIDQIPVPPPEDNAMSIKRGLDLASDGTLKVSYKVTYTGSSEASVRGSARDLKPEEYEKQVRASIAGLSPDYVLLNASHSDPLDFSNQYSSWSEYILNKYVTKSGKYFLLELPYFKLRFPEVALEKRTYDIVYTTSSLNSSEIIVNLPASASVKYAPPSLKIDLPYVNFETTYSVEGSKLIIKRRMAAPKRTVPVADYSKYKEALEKISRYTDERIYIEDSSCEEKSAGKK